MTAVLEAPVYTPYKVKDGVLMNIDDAALIVAVSRAFTFEHLMNERGLDIKAPDAADLIECTDPDAFHDSAVNQSVFNAYLSTASILRTTSADAHSELLTDITLNLFSALAPSNLYPAVIGDEQCPELARWMAFVCGAVDVPSENLLLAGVMIERLLWDKAGAEAAE